MDMNQLIPIIGKEATDALTPKERGQIIAMHTLGRGFQTVYMTGRTGDPMSPVGRVALAYWNAGKITLTQQRVTASTGPKAGNGTFNYIATGLTDATIAPKKYEYLQD